MSRGAHAAVLALLVACGSWPWLGELRLWPMAPDSATWIARADPAAPGWFEWTFLTSHFDVGWRPLTALAFTANRLVLGLEPLGYRLTDLALHALTAVLVAALARRLAPQAPAWTGWLAAAVLLAHPVSDEVVPFLARRSYPLGSALSLAAALVFLPPPAEATGRTAPSQARALAAGLLVALAVAANEASILSAAALPLLALVRGTGEEREPRSARLAALVRATAWLALPVAALVAARWAVVGGLGGYELAGDEGGRAGRAPEVLLAAWRELGGVARAPEAAVWVALLLVLPFYAWRAFRRRGPELVLALWVAAYPLLYASQGVWFPRQAYVAVVPLALLVALVAARTADGPAGTRALCLLPQLALAGLLLWSSPAVRGPDRERVAERQERDALIDAALADLRALAATARDEPLDVHLVLPYAPPRAREDALRARAAGRELSRASRVPAQWLATCLAGERVRPLEFLYVRAGPPGPPATEEGPRRVRIRAGSAYYLVEPGPEGTRLRRRDEEAPRSVAVPPGQAWIAPR